MLGQVHEKVITARGERPQQAGLGPGLRDHAAALPVPVDGVQSGDRRMAFEHRRGFKVDERVDFGRGQRILQHREHRRGEQDVAVMAQLGDQNATHEGSIDGVGRNVQHAPKIPNRFVRYKR